MGSLCGKPARPIRKQASQRVSKSTFGSTEETCVNPSDELGACNTEETCINPSNELGACNTEETCVNPSNELGVGSTEGVVDESVGKFIVPLIIQGTLVTIQESLSRGGILTNKIKEIGTQDDLDMHNQTGIKLIKHALAINEIINVRPINLRYDKFLKILEAYKKDKDEQTSLYTRLGIESPFVEQQEYGV